MRKKPDKALAELELEARKAMFACIIAYCQKHFVFDPKLKVRPHLIQDPILDHFDLTRSNSNQIRINEALASLGVKVSYLHGDRYYRGLGIKTHSLQADSSKIGAAFQQ